MMRKMCILVPLLLVLVPLCEQALQNIASYNTGIMTWSEAQAFCRTHHTDLVTLRNEEENQQLSRYRGWIGMHREDDNSPWKWSRGDKKVNFTLWGPGEPVSNRHCVARWAYSRRWYAIDCHRAEDFICYDERLVLVKENKTWEEALDHCRSLRRVDTNNPASAYWNHSYDLVTLTSEFDHSYARSEAREATTDEVWTGLRFLAGEWLWVGGEEVNYNIPSCEADRFCGVLEKKGELHFGLRSCNERRNFFCHRRS